MADRYWVGGTATWDSSTTSVWSASSGGAGGASVPTSSDNVFFDQAGTYTITIGATNTPCANLTVSATTYTFQSNSVQVFGNLTLASGTVWNLSYFFGGTGNYTLTTNGVSGNSLICITGATINLGSALTLPFGSIVSFSNGSVLNTLGYSLTCATIGAFTTGTRTINFSNSAVTLTAGGTANNWSAATVTSSAGATVTFTAPSPLGITFRAGTNNYIPALIFSNSGPVSIYGDSTFQNISSPYVGAKSFYFLAGGTYTFIAFNLRGTSGNLYTITSTTTSAATIKKAGTWYMGANSTDGGNNTNLTFSNGSGIDYLNVSYITGSSVPVTGNFLAFF